LLLVSPLPAADSDPAASGPVPAAAPATQAVPEYLSVQKLPDDITLATLSNGLTVVVQENHVAPVATVRCYVKNTGSAYEGRHLGAGLSHVLEHVVAGGTTTKRSEKEIEKIIDTFGGATNAYTSTDLTAFYIDCPGNRTMTAVELVADSMQRIKFEPAEFERELRVVRRELADGEVDRGRVLWKMMGQTVYAEHPVRHPIIGYLDVLGATTNQTIIDFYHSRYVPNNQIFVVVGDVKTDAVLAQVAKQWAGTPRGNDTAVAMPEEPEQLGPREAIREMDGTTYDLALAWPTVELSHPDLYALDVAAYILGEGDSSRLVHRLKYDEQVVLSVSSVSNTPSFVRGWFGVIASSRPQTWEKASDAILQEVYRLREEPISQAELEKAKKQKAAERVFDQQTVQSAAESLGRGLLTASDPLFDRKYVEGIQKVTAEQIQEVARKYFVPERLNRIIIAPPGGAPKSAQQQAAAKSEEIRTVQLPNGVRVLLKRHTHLPLVNIQAYVLAGSLVDTEKTAGRSALLGAMLDKGTAGYTAQQIADYFDSIGGKLSMAAGRSSIYGSATVLKGDFPKAAELFAKCFTQPTFPQDQFEKVKQLALGAIARRADDPQQEIVELFYDNLPATSPYHLLQGGKKESVEAISVDDSKAYHARYFVPNNMIVTVFGDIDPDEALRLVETNFGQLKPDPSLKPIDFSRPNDIPASITRHKQTGKPIGMVMFGYEGTSVLDGKDYAALTLLDAIMSGYSYPGGWLHNALRGEGLVYFVHAFQITGPAAGFFAILAQTQPEKVSTVVERIEQFVDRARQGQITEDEFRTAQQMVIALHAQENTTISGQAQQAALDDLYGLGYDYDKKFDQRILEVTRDDVAQMARKCFGNRVLVTSSPGPAPAGSTAVTKRAEAGGRGLGTGK
jgi:zinc protease